MFKQLFLGVLIFAVSVIYVPLPAQAVDMSTALKRMDEIIKQMEALRVEFSALSSSVSSTATPTVLGAQTTKTLTQDLSYGATNSDIERIQKLLATDPAIYPYGVSSGFFGPKTQEAIRNFQTRFGLDPVGVIGPATTALLELFFNAYPTGAYPAGVLDKKPQVLGVSTNVPSTTVTPGTSVVSSAKSIVATLDSGEALIEIVYTNGNRKGLIADTEDKDEIADYVASKTVLSKAQVLAVLKIEKVKSSNSSSGADEGDAEDALDDAEDAIDDAFDAIEEADDDGDDVDWAEETLEEAEDLFDEAEEAFDDEDYDEAVDKAEQAEKLAKKAEDRIDQEKGDEQGDNDDIEAIIAEVDEDESEITVEYDGGDEYVFTVEEDKEKNIIEEVADELDMDEDDVEDLIEFDFGKISKIEADVSKGIAFVTYKTGVERRVYFDETDEDDIIDELSDELDEDSEDIEEWIEFD